MNTIWQNWVIPLIFPRLLRGDVLNEPGLGVLILGQVTHLSAGLQYPPGHSLLMNGSSLWFINFPMYFSLWAKFLNLVWFANEEPGCPSPVDSIKAYCIMSSRICLLLLDFCKLLRYFGRGLRVRDASSFWWDTFFFKIIVGNNS